MSSLFRDDLDAIPAYIPGRSIPGAIKISSNEVTDAPDQSIIDAVELLSPAVIVTRIPVLRNSAQP